MVLTKRSASGIWATIRVCILNQLPSNPISLPWAVLVGTEQASLVPKDPPDDPHTVPVPWGLGAWA